MSAATAPAGQATFLPVQLAKATPSIAPKPCRVAAAKLLQTIGPGRQPSVSSGGRYP